MKTFFLSIFLVLGMASGTGAVAQTLYPPTNVYSQFIEDVIYTEWDRPVNTSGQTPPGLVGYYVYDNGIQVDYITDPDTVGYYTFNPFTGWHVYEVTANYDMSFYGNPGVFQQSSPAGPDSIYYDFHGCPVPFFEPWDMGTFYFNDWEFEPDPGNWKIIITDGNPAPVAVFDSAGGISDYNHRLVSTGLQSRPESCTDIFLHFDYKLNDVSQSGTEFLKAEIYCNNQWTEVVSYSNTGSTEWIHQSLILNDFIIGNFKIGFEATGQNSANIYSWMIDNIHVYGICYGPQNLQFSTQDNLVNLSWQYPCDTSAGIVEFNIWRTNITGTGSFNKIGSTTGLYYTDTVNNTVTSGQYRYYVSALYEDPNNPGIYICEGESDTLLVYLPLGNREITSGSVRVINSGNYLTVSSDKPIESCALYNLSGSRLFEQSVSGKTNLSIPVSGLPGGIYLVRIITQDSRVQVVKVVIT